MAFAWLPPLALAGGEAARTLATNLIAQWVKRYARYSEPVWLPHIMARRLMHIFSHGRLVVLEFRHDVALATVRVACANSPGCWSAFRGEAPDGLPRLEAAAALALSGICLDDCPKRLEAGPEAAGRGNRAPDSARWRPCRAARPKPCSHAYRYLTMVMDALAAANAEPPHALAQCPRPHGADAALFPPWRRRAGAVPGRAGKRSAHDRGPSGARRGARASLSIMPAIPAISGWRRGAP